MEKEKLLSIDCLHSLIIAVIVSFVMISLFRMTTTIGSSMENTLHEGEHHIIWLAKRPVKGSIVVINKMDDLDAMIIKRVIATGGDHLRIDHGKVYVNGKLLDEPYIKEQEFEPETLDLEIPKNKFFVMGDNRNNSMDSRSEEVGLIEEKEMMGVLVKSLPIPSQLLIYVSGIAIFLVTAYLAYIVTEWIINFMKRNKG